MWARLGLRGSQQAARILTAIGEVARGNPTLAVIRASAEHAAGLLTSDVSLLQHASAQLPDPWARACAVEDQGVLQAAAARDRDATSGQRSASPTGAQITGGYFSTARELGGIQSVTS
jgi:hypothetical protein